MERFPQVRLFGGPALIDATGERPTTPAQRNLLALAYCHPPGTLTREQVAWLLWERGEDRKTRHGIRQLIYAINTRAGVAVLERDGDAVLPCLPSDATEVEPSDGAPLALITSAPTPSYEHWLDGAKETLRRLRRRRLAAMVDRARSSMDWGRVADLTKRLVVIENTNHVWLEMFTSSSIRAGKVATCMAFLADLRGDDVLSEDDYYSLLGRLESVRASPGPESQEESELALVGRETEVAWLEERIRSATGLRFAVLGGAAGIGKTRLLEEATRIAAASGRRVGVVRLTELSGSAPLTGMDRLLSQVLTDDDLARIPEPWSGVLQSGVGKGTGLEVLEPSANNRRLTQAFRIAFQELTRAKPIALLVDDLHWLDATSLDLLQNLAVDWSGGACTLVLTARVEYGATLPPKIAAFVRAVRADFLSLKGLQPEHCGRLLTLAGLQNLSEEDLAGLIGIARGNPLLLLDLGRVWCSGSWPRASVPDTLHAVVTHRLASLDGLQTQVLSVVAAGNDMTSTDIESCLKLPTWDVVDALNVLVTLDLIEPHGARYGFRHSLLREAVTLALGDTRAREAHLRIGRWLADSGDGSSAEIVHHFRHANALDDAFEWAKAAASHARNAGALVEALQFFEIALESTTEGLDPVLCADAGRLALLLCQRDKGIRLLERAEALGDQSNPMWRVERIDALSEDGRLDHQSAADQAHSTAQEAAREGNWVTYLAATETAIRILERAGDWYRIKQLLGEVAKSGVDGDPRAQVRRGMILALGMVYGSPTEAGRAARAAFRLARRMFPNSDLTARAAHRLFVVLLSEGTVNSQLGHDCRRLLEERARLTGDLRLQYTTLANLAVWYLDTGDLEAAEITLRDAEGLVAGSEATNERQNLATNRGDLLLRQNDPTRALEFFEEAENLIDAGTRGFLRDICRSGVGICHLRMGRFRSAEIALSDIGAHDHYYFDPSLPVRLRVEVLWHRGKRDEALDHLAASRLKIRNSFVPQYLNLVLWEVALRRRSERPGGPDLAREAIEIAEPLGLNRVVARAKALADLSRS